MYRHITLNTIYYYSHTLSLMLFHFWTMYMAWCLTLYNYCIYCWALSIYNCFNFITMSLSQNHAYTIVIRSPLLTEAKNPIISCLFKNPNDHYCWLRSSTQMTTIANWGQKLSLSPLLTEVKNSDVFYCMFLFYHFSNLFLVFINFNIFHLFLSMDLRLTLVLLPMFIRQALVYYIGCWFSLYLGFSANESICLILV